jgi:hypothetical protein
MPGDKETIEQFAARIKAKYPDYKDIPDTELVNRIVAKHPEYKERVDFGVVSRNATTQTPQPQYQGNVDFSNTLNLAFPNYQNELDAKHQYEVAGAQSRIDKTLQSPQTDAAIKSLLTKQKSQAQLAQIQDNLKTRGLDANAGNIDLSRVQNLIPKASIQVNDNEVKQYRDAMQKNPDLARMALYENATLNPSQAKQIAADTYILDSKDRAKGNNVGQILKNKEAIEKGDNEYSIWHGGQVTKPEGLLQSLGRGFGERTQQFKDYDFLNKAKDEDIINEYEKRRATQKPEDEPVPVPHGISGGFGKMMGSEGPTLAKGALPAVLDVATGGGATAAVPWLSALLTSPDFYERGYANAFNQHYNELRDQGHSPEEALKIAKNRATFDASTDVAVGAAMSATGAKIGAPGAVTGKFTPGFMGAVKGAVKEMAASTPEAASVGALGGLAQAAKNVHSGKPASEGVAEAALVPIAFHFGIKTIAAGTKIGGSLFKSSVENMAKQPEETVNKTIGEQVESGEITPEKATEVYNQIDEKRQQNAALVDKAKESVTKGAVKGVEGEPLQADINDPEKFDAHLKHIADQAHDPKTAEKVEETYGKDLVDVARQLHPAEDIPSLIEANRKFDLKEVDDEIGKLSKESADYGKKKEALEKQKTQINDYYDNYGKHHEEINSPKIEDNGKTDQTIEALPQTHEVGNKGTAKEAAPFSNQQIEAASGFFKQGIENGTIDKEYEQFGEHPDHLLGYIREEVQAGKGDEMEKEFGKDLVTLSQQQAHYPIVRNIKPKENAPTQQIAGAVDVGQPPVNGETMGSGNAQSEGTSGESQPEAQSQSAREEKIGVPPENDLPFVNEPGDESITGIRNSITAQKIEEAGLTPVLKEVARTHPEVWQEALAKVKKGYDPQTLVDQLKKKARPLSDTEDALLLIHQVDKESQLDAINRQLTEVGQKGDEAQFAELNLQKAKIKDDLQDIYDVDKAVGTANARGLSARQMIADRKYFLVNMEMEARANKGGKPLTEEEAAAVEKKYNEIKEARDAIQKRADELEAENKALKAKQTLKKVVSREKKSKADYDQQKADVIKQMREDLLKAAKGGEGLTSSIPFAAQLKVLAPHVAKLAKIYAEQGLDKIEEIAARIYDVVKDQVQGITKNHIYDMIAGEFDPKTVREGEPVNDQSIRPKLKDQAKQIKYAITDPELMKRRANYERVKESWGDEMRKKELAGRTKSQKIQDTFVKWQRAFKLSGITTLAKLSSAALTRLSTTPAEEAIGGVYSKGLPKVAAKATGEGGVNLKAEAKAITSAFTQGMKDSADILSKKTRGKSDIEAVFGKNNELPPEAIGFFGQLHSALKAPVKRAAFERSMTKRIAANLKAGVDVSDPMVQSKIAIQAYKDANRAIFMQDNFISDSYRNFVNSLERSKKYPTQGKAVATALQWLIPFVKVPTNIVGEVGTNVAGVPIAAGKLIYTALTKGLDNLTEEEADMVMRNLKKGSIGAGALLLGYFNPESFGGYYEKYEKRKPGDLKAGQSKVFGLTIPAWLQESPIFQTMQLGATVRRVQDKIVHGEPEGITKGIWAGAMGLVEHEPLIDQPARVMGAIKDPKEREYFLGQLAKSTVVPAAVSNIAQWTDPAETRKPSTVLEHIETGIPGLRENVPEKIAPKNTSKKAGKRNHKR